MLIRILFTMMAFATISQAFASEDVADTSSSNPQNYVCKRYVNCMPMIGGGENKYCSDDYFAWAEVNCQVKPQMVQ